MISRSISATPFLDLIEVNKKLRRGRRLKMKRSLSPKLTPWSAVLIRRFLVTLNIVNYDIHHILIDNRSSLDMLFYDAFIKMGLS